jgi:hypothetical protein
VLAREAVKAVAPIVRGPQGGSVSPGELRIVQILSLDGLQMHAKPQAFAIAVHVLAGSYGFAEQQQISVWLESDRVHTLAAAVGQVLDYERGHMTLLTVTHFQPITHMQKRATGPGGPISRGRRCPLLHSQYPSSVIIQGRQQMRHHEQEVIDHLAGLYEQLVVLVLDVPVRQELLAGAFVFLVGHPGADPQVSLEVGGGSEHLVNCGWH